jgi:anti-sigma B factor antagonist
MAVEPIPSPIFQVDVIPERERILVTPRGELDLSTVGCLEAEVQELRSRGFTAIVLDLRQLDFMDSTGLRLLLRLDAEARSDGFSFSIIDADGPIRRLLDLTQMRDRLEQAEP